MFYISSTENWLESVIRNINDKHLDPLKCTFMIGVFGSMDNKLIDYFYKNKDRINQASGEGFHIFTPFIHKETNTLIDDNYARNLRREFKALGFPITTDPSFIFFNLQKNDSGEYIPNFFAIFTLKNTSNINTKLKHTIEEILENNYSVSLVPKLEEIFGTPSILPNYNISPVFVETITNKLPNKRIFVSYSITDRKIVTETLSKLDSLADFWIDYHEIKPGDNILANITKGLEESDYLLLFISKTAVNSEWVKHEISQFASKNKRIIPVLLEPNISFPDPINQIILSLNYISINEDNIIDKLNLLLKK